MMQKKINKFKKTIKILCNHNKIKNNKLIEEITWNNKKMKFKKKIY